MQCSVLLRKSMFEKGNLKHHTTIFLPDASDLVKIFFCCTEKKHGYLRHGAMYYSIGSILFKSGRPTKSHTLLFSESIPCNIVSSTPDGLDR
jgi:hypothetical protein